jgi:hypothetical protein
LEEENGNISMNLQEINVYFTYLTSH